MISIASLGHSLNQDHVCRFVDSLTEGEQAGLVVQLESIDATELESMKDMLVARDTHGAGAGISPAAVVKLAPEDSEQISDRGRNALRSGQVGVLLVAGGQGSRLGYEGPKGCYPIGPVSGCSLFEIHARKILALSEAFGAPVPFYIMTSGVNDAATRAFFLENSYFGLDPEHVMFFQQGMYPALTAEGKLILDRPDHIFMSPDGHGGMLTALSKTGMLDDMSARGLATLFYFQVDNPLVEIADPAFIGQHLSAGADASVKVCAKRDPGEGLGVVVVRDGETCIVEYSELTEEQANARESDGELTFKFGSVAIHVFSLAFLIASFEKGLPLHLAHKKVPYLDESGACVTPSEANAYKFETFIFDTLPMANTVLNIEFEREDEFSPVKNAEGSDSPATTRRDIVRKAVRWLESCGIRVPRGEDGESLYQIEIDPCYAWNSAALKKRLPEGFEVTGDLLLKD